MGNSSSSVPTSIPNLLTRTQDLHRIFNPEQLHRHTYVVLDSKYRIRDSAGKDETPGLYKWNLVEALGAQQFDGSAILTEKLGNLVSMRIEPFRLPNVSYGLSGSHVVTIEIPELYSFGTQTQNGSRYHFEFAASSNIHPELTKYNVITWNLPDDYTGPPQIDFQRPFAITDGNLMFPDYCSIVCDNPGQSKSELFFNTPIANSLSTISVRFRNPTDVLVLDPDIVRKTMDGNVQFTTTVVNSRLVITFPYQSTGSYCSDDLFICSGFTTDLPEDDAAFIAELNDPRGVRIAKNKNLRSWLLLTNATCVGAPVDTNAFITPDSKRFRLELCITHTKPLE